MAKAGRNDPCPCGSGKKYKQCCMSRDAAQGTAQLNRQAAARAQAGQQLQAAINLHRGGQLAAAEKLYQAVLQSDPNQPDALHLLGVIAYQSGNLGSAIELIGKATRIKGNDANYFANLGLALMDAGRLDEAAASYRKVLALQPRHAEAHFNLGNIASRRGNDEEAGNAYRATLALDPNHSNAHNNLGALLCAQGRFGEAEEHLRRALGNDPNHVDARANLAHLLMDTARADAAEAEFRTVLASSAQHGDAAFNLAVLLKRRGAIEEATKWMEHAVGLPSATADLHYQLGTLYDGQGRLEDAVKCYARAVAGDPLHVAAFNNLGVAQFNLGRIDQAVESYRHALALRDDIAEMLVNLANALRERGDWEEAQPLYRRAVEIDPDSANARFAMTLGCLAVLHENTAHVTETRQRLSAALDELATWCAVDGGLRCAGAVGSLQPFYLAYQELDNRDLLARHGDICAAAMGSWLAGQGLHAAPVEKRERLRVGIVSAHLNDHSVWNAFLRGWVEHLDRSRFEVFLYSLGGREDRETAWASERAQRFVAGRNDLHGWCKTILADRPDVLIYPEIGMDIPTTRLASLRLAPLQAASWGHPETSGLPTIDFFLSADALEPPNAARHYREKLFALPRLGCCYQPLGVTANSADLPEVGLHEGMPLLLAPGVPFKYPPQHDAVFVEIARRLGRCRLVFFHTERTAGVARHLKQRLQGAFAAADLDFDEFGVFLPWQSRAAFYALLQRADVFLDTIGFSGFNTAMQAVECALPIITREGRFLRGRLAGGILQQLGLNELIAADEAQYVELAVRLAQDAGYRDTVRQRIAAHRDALYGDVGTVRALEDFLVTTCQGTAP